MIRSSIRTKILAIAVGMIVLMVITAVLSLTLVTQVGHRLDQMTNSYIPAYGNLARGNIRSLERALALRRMVIAKSRSPPDQATFSTAREVFDEKGAEVVREAQSARTLINGLITQGTSFADGAALARIETRIDAVLDDSRRHLNTEVERLLPLLDGGNAASIADDLARIDALRDELNQKIDGIRSDMLALVRSDAAATLQRQHEVIWIAAVLRPTGRYSLRTFLFCCWHTNHHRSPPKCLTDNDQVLFLITRARPGRQPEALARVLLHRPTQERTWQYRHE
jgi:hypothetical protein